MRLSKLFFAPLPKTLEIIKSFYSYKKKSDFNFKSYLKINNSKSFWFSRSAWAIFLIAKFRIKFSSSKSINVWIPDYFCNSSLVPLRSLDVKIIFYPIQLNRYADLKKMREINQNNLPDIVLFVNYFGNDYFLDQLFDFAKQNNAWLIEDSAHCIKPIERNKCADFILYSPHKLLPIPDGALLIVNKKGPNIISNKFLKEFDFSSLYSSVVQKSHILNFSQYKWLTKRIFQKFGFSRSSSKLGLNAKEPLLNFKNFPKPYMSNMAKSLLFNMPINFTNESEVRNNNYDDWRRLIINNTKLNSVATIPSINYVPYLCELIVEDKNQMDEIFNLFKNVNIPVSTWPDLAPEVLLDNVKHSVAIEMRMNRIFLPVHSSVNEKIIKFYLHKIRI